MTRERERELWEELSDAEALGEVLSESERALRNQISETDPVCAMEGRVYQELGEALGRASGSAPKQERLIETALRTAHEERGSFLMPRHWFARHGALIAGTLAAMVGLSAALVYVVGLRGGELIRPEAVTLAFSEAGVRSNGTAVAVGAKLDVGTIVETGPGSACVELERQVVVCAGAHSMFEVTALGPRQQLRLLSGHLVSVLAHQPIGTEFSVTTRAGSVTAVGTIFAVEVVPGGATSISVAEGAVSARTPASEVLVKPGEELRFGASAAVAVPRQRRERDAAVLAPLAQFAPESARRAASVYAADPVGVAARVARDTESASSPQLRVAERPETGRAAPATSATELLEQAVQARRQGAYVNAAREYERLIKHHPQSPEGRTALLGLAEIRLSRLGDAAAALRLYDAYLRRGGGLAQEAHYGKIQALSELGRVAEVRKETLAFLQRYPKSTYARSLEKRLPPP